MELGHSAKAGEFCAELAEQGAECQACSGRCLGLWLQRVKGKRRGKESAFPFSQL